MEQALSTLPSYLIAADSHNIGNTDTSWLDVDTWTQKFGNIGKLAATSILSGANSFYNTGVAVGRWFGSDATENDTQSWIANIDSDLGSYYKENKQTADLVGFVLGSLIPGLGGVKILNAGQMALKTAVKTGHLGKNLSSATGLLIPDVQMYTQMAATQINASTSAVKLLNAQTAKALGAGIWQNTLEAAAFETVVQATMFKSPILEAQDASDIAMNVMVGGVLGGVIGGAFSAAKAFGFLKKAVKAEDVSRLPFVSRPALSEITSPSERIAILAHDSDMAAMPVSILNAEGDTVVNNFAVTKTLYDDKIRKNFNDIRAATNQLAGKDSELGNILANQSTPIPGVSGYSQGYFENFSGAIHVARATELTPAEIAISKALRKGEVSEQTVASRYVTLIGEDAGKVSDSIPAVISLADKYKGKEAVVGKVRSYGFTPKKEWNALELAGRDAHLEAEARQIYAKYLLKEIKPDSIVNRYDIPILERAFEDGVLSIKIVDGKNLFTPASKQDLWEMIKESKTTVAAKMQEKKYSNEAAARITNMKQAYMEGYPGASEYDDLMQNQAIARIYKEGIEERGLSTAVGEFTDPLFLPKVAKIVYDVAENVAATTENVVDAMVYFKSQQKLYEQAAKNVVAKNLGSIAESLPDISDKALFTANRTGSGPGLISAENSNYGTVGSTMAWIGSVTRSAKESLRKTVSESLQNPLVRLGAKPEAALEFESVNQKINRSGKQWLLVETSVGDTAMVEAKTARLNDLNAVGNMDQFGNKLDRKLEIVVDFEALDPSNYITLKHTETIEAITAHIQTGGRRTTGFREIRSAQGHTDFKDPEVFRPIRPDLKQYPHFAFVTDPAVTGTGHKTMIWAASDKELTALIDRVPTNYKVLTKTDTEEFFKARKEYEFSRTLHENYIDTDLANRGVFSNFFPKSDPDKIINDVLQQHLRESDILVQETVRLRYEPQFNWFEDLGRTYSKTATSKFASRSELIEQTTDNPYFNYIKTALDISKASENPLIYGFNKMLDSAVSKAVGAVRETFQNVKTPADMHFINAALDEFGMKPAYYDSALHILANHTAPRGELTKFVRNANGLLSLFTLGLDPLNSLNNAIGSNILRMTELKHLTRAIAAGDTEIAGTLAGIAKITLPGVDDQILSPTKLVGKAIENFWKDTGPLIGKYKELGFIKDRAEQLKLLVDDFTLKGTETVSELNSRFGKGFEKAKKLAELGEKGSGNKLAEEFNRFVSANVMDQITQIGIAKGLMDEATAKAYINTFVNRVEGNIIASQRPLIFQGPVGQAIGLFQSYQFNLMQQLFRYVAEGSSKDLGMLIGLQSTLYGLQSLPAFQFVNTHIVGQLSGNTEHRDAYDAVYGAAGRTAGNWMLYGLPSNLLQTNIYSRGDINPRQITVLPTSMQEIPIVAGWGKFLGSMKEMVGKIAGGGNIWESVLQGVEHNGISRPLAGFAQTLQGIPSGQVYSTSSKGSILHSNDLMSFATLTRLAGGRPLDEAVTNDALFRVKSYEAARRNDMNSLSETVKSTLIGDESASQEQVNRFASRYAELGGKQAGFNKWMMGLYKNSNVPQSQQLEMNLKNPFAYKMQLLMGGSDD